MFGSGQLGQPSSNLRAHEKKRGRGSILPARLDAEGAAAAAGALDVRVVELETRAFDGFDVVDLDAIEVHLAHLVDENLEAVKFVHAVTILVHGVLKGHVVAE